ncbi:MAG TPA: epoxide hydrolase [Vicinamibacterales bacterium]|jgi:microsomal epoxide hydrolase
MFTKTVVCIAATIAALCASASTFAQSPPAAATSRSDAIVPFKIQVPDAVLRDLKTRLKNTRLAEPIPNTGWDYGTDATYLRSLVDYWRDRYDWRAQERKLNELPQFKTTIDGLEIHFVHIKSKEPHALPLAMTHGWPGSFFEFTKVVGPLTDPVKYGGRAEDAFDVVAISLPGFGFSGKPQERGYSPEKMGAIIATLMARLGYTRYGLQGGDWGGIISRLVAIDDAPHVAGLHLNFCLAGPPPGGAPMDGVPADEVQRYQTRETYMANERAYQQIQGTKPQTLGFLLDDSPAGLAAWIVEKFHAWCDCGDNIESRFSKDDLLTDVMVYWVTRTGSSSTRIYFENRVARPNPARVTVPTGCALFPKEISVPPRKWVEARYNLVHWTVMPRGGHFAALEQPELLVADVRDFFKGLR